MKRLVSLGLCFILSLVLIFGSVIPASFTPQNNAFAVDMGDMGGGGSGDGEPKDDSAHSGGDGGGTGTGDGGDGKKDGGDNDNKGGGGDGEKKQDSNPKAITLGSCDPGEEPDIFTDKCVVVAENPANTGPATPTPIPTTCLVSYNPEESDQSSVWGMKNKQLMKINRGVFYYTVDDKKIQQQQLSLFHQMQGMQLGKTYDLSSYSGLDCNINQVRNKDGSITATITFPTNVKQVIRTDTTGKVPIQINTLDHNDKMWISKAVDDNGIATTFKQNVGGVFVEPGLQGVEITEPGGTRPIISVVLDSKDGSLKTLSRGELGHSTVGRDELQDDNDGDPTVATTKSGMKVTVTPSNVAYPNPGASKDDPLATMSSDHSVVRVTNPDSSVKTHMIINPDGSVQPGPKWTARAPVEPELPIEEEEP